MEYEIEYDGVKARWIVGYEGRYRITEDGRVVSYATSNTKEIFGSLDAKGYVKITLTDESKIQKTYKAHRLVATAFIPAVEGKYDIDHRDEDKTNNHEDNLRWCTKAENLEYYRTNHPTEEKVPERVYGTVEDMVKATGKSIVVSGQEFVSCGSAAQWIVDQELALGNTRKKATISKELRRFLQGKRLAWTMYERYTIGT